MRGILAMMITGTVCLCVLFKIIVPGEMWGVVGGVVALYYGFRGKT